MRLDENHFGNRPETQEQWTFTRMLFNQGAEFFEAFWSELSRVEPQMNLLGKPSRRLIQRQNLLGKKFWAFFSGIDLTDNEDGVSLHQKLAVVVVILVDAKHLDDSDQVLQCHDRVRLAGFLGKPALDGGYHSPEPGHRTIGQLWDRLGIGQRVFFQDRCIRRQGMPCYIKPQQL